MFKRKLAIACAAFFTLLACCACGGGEGTHTHTDADGDGYCDDCKDQMPESGGKPSGGGTTVDKTPFQLSDYQNLPAVRLSSLYAVEESGICKMKYTVPDTDTYTFDFSNKAVNSLELYDEAGKQLKASESGFDIELTEGQTVYVRVDVVKNKARFTVKAKENLSPLPFEIAEAPDPASFETTSADPAADPLQPAKLNYVKRDGTLYVYCNAPEGLTKGPQVINKCTTRQDVSDQSVYFTMEQQSNGLKDLGAPWNFPDNGVYYGYRVTNTGTEDLYITVRNIGWQLDGEGAYLGEKEWIDFYNTRFELPDFSDMNESQLRLFEAYYGFSGEYRVHDFQPTTYRIPAGKYMYVMGGTTQDAFDGFSVAGTANQKSTFSTCGNAAVLFDVVGKAEGAYYVYNDIAEVMPGGAGCDTHMGINDPVYGEVHTGEDVGYVVDNQATWVFNDATPAQKLPVTFDNYYSDDAPAIGEPNTPIPNTTKHTQNLTTWVTHIDVQQNHIAVGTDMTTFHTVNKNGDRIQVGCNYYDTRGEFPNIGNWMKDYQDLFTFVNQGDKEREITLNLGCSGAVVVLVRDMEGKRVPDSWTYSMVHGADPKFGQGFDKALRYKIKVPAHSVVQYVLEYNLMANSNGNVTHSVDLL